MNKSEKYEAAEVEVIYFAAEDAITTSGLTDGGSGEGGSDTFNSLNP